MMTLNTDNEPIDQLGGSIKRFNSDIGEKDNSDLYAQVIPTKLSDNIHNPKTNCGTIIGLEPGLDTHEKLFLQTNTLNLFRTSLASHSRTGNKFMLHSVLPSSSAAATYEQCTSTIDISWPPRGNPTTDSSFTSTAQLGLLVGNNLSELRDNHNLGFLRNEASSTPVVLSKPDTHEEKSASANSCESAKSLEYVEPKLSSSKRLQGSPTPIPTKRPKAGLSSPLGLINVKNVGSDKQLMEAARKGDYNQVRRLVENHCGLYSSDWSGTTALHVAAQNGHKDIVEILLNAGANQDARTKVERTALHLAAQYGHLPVVDMLISYWSDVNAVDMLKMSPLHWATDKGHVNVVERLLQAGADVSLKSKFHLTPRDIAYGSQSEELVEVFKKYSTDILSPLYAVKQEQREPKQSTCNESENESHVERSEQSCLTPSVTMTHDSDDFDLEESCFDFMEFDWSNMEVPADFLLQGDSDDGEPQLEYLMKVVEKLQRENTHLRLKVEQLSSEG